jgi:hypothetical protein
VAISNAGVGLVIVTMCPEVRPYWSCMCVCVWQVRGNVLGKL